VAQQSDFLVIGSGVAGLSFSLRVAESGTVTVLTKKEKVESNTNYAQGGIAAVFSSDDSFDLHARDTFEAGVGLCHRDAVELIVQEAPEQIRDLERWGVEFTHGRSKDSDFDLGREGGHSKNRIVHALDKTGMVMEHALIDRVKNHPNIQVLDNQMAVDLITEHHLMGGGKSKTGEIHCWGAYALDASTGNVEVYLAKVTLVAAGGAGRVYLHTTNPAIATGDGVAMALRAGASIANLEFMQFHPTSLFHDKGESFLISEAVRGYGGILKSGSGPFMSRYDERAELAPRDIVARAIDSEMKKTGDPCVFLDVTHLDGNDVQSHFPQINERLLELKIDMTKEPIPVVPAAHYMCGGIISDMYGRTDVEGLFVVGESACTGVHGANRLASNSLLEALVFSERAAGAAFAYYRGKPAVPPSIPAWDDKGTYDHEEWVLISHDLKEIQRLMWDYVGIVRSDERLKRARKRINVIMDQVNEFYKKAKVTAGLLELRNLCLVASLIIKSALFRKESRGLHFTTDYPERNDEEWLGDTVIRGKKIEMNPIEPAL